MLRTGRKTTQHRSRSLSNRASHKDRAKNSSWGSPDIIWRGLGHSWVFLGRRLAGFWPLLDGSWSLWGVSWAPLERFLDDLGCPLAGLTDFEGAFCLPGTPQASILEGLGPCRARFCKALETYFAMSFAASRALLHNAFMCAVNTLLHLSTLLLLPFRCGGLCAALGILTQLGQNYS